LRALQNYPEVKAWISFSCKDGEHISNGDSLKEAVELLNKADTNNQIVAVGVNCTAP
jgi:homocysteine S-methyltransferase